jgi:hypothetical protein
LVEAASKKIDYVTIICSALGQGIVKLLLVSNNADYELKTRSYLQCLLVVFNVVTVNVVVRTNGLFQFGAHNKARTLSSRAACEQHDMRTGILEGGFK